MSPGTVRVGCSGWQYRDWRGALYPEGVGQARWLGRYAEVFDTVEVNSTFYRLASRDAVERWVRQTPPDFLFALKASRYLIHMRKLRDTLAADARALRTGCQTSSVPRQGTASTSSSATAFHPVPSDATGAAYERGPTAAPARSNMARRSRALRTANPSQSLLK